MNHITIQGYGYSQLIITSGYGIHPAEAIYFPEEIKIFRRQEYPMLVSISVKDYFKRNIYLPIIKRASFETSIITNIHKQQSLQYNLSVSLKHKKLIKLLKGLWI